MSSLTQLRTYATMDPTAIPDSVRLCHSARTVTIHDKYPKGLYHALVLPLIRPPLRAAQLASLRALLTTLPREQARAVLVDMQRDAQEAVSLIEEDMRRTQGFVWDVHAGFHALPSVEHLHLHLVSGEFLGEYFKTKKHNNSFHPRMGFFLPLAEVLGWLDADVEPSWFATKAKMESKAYAPILKADMLCPHCDAVYKTIPKLKLHLAEVFAEMKKRKIAQRAREKRLADAPKVTKDTQLEDRDATSSARAPAANPAAASQEGGEMENILDAGTRSKRKHEEPTGDESEDIKDHDLPEPTPAKRQQLEGKTSGSNSS